MTGEPLPGETPGEARCGGHEALVDELRAHAAGFLNLLEPWINQVRDAPPSPGGTPVTCASCPLCALMALLRGERSEMAVRVAEQAAGLLAVLRAALAEGNGSRAGAHQAHAHHQGNGQVGGQGNGQDDGQDNGQVNGRANGHAHRAAGATARVRPAPEDSRDVQRIPVSRADGGTASDPC